MTTDKIVLGIFSGPWNSGHVARDGAVLCFSDVERAVKRSLKEGTPRPFHIVELDISLFLSDDPERELRGLDIVFANCGPLAAFLLDIRARNNLDFSIVREVHTLGWVGYAFQEFVAAAFQRPGDLCTYPSVFSKQVWQDFRGPGADVLYCPTLWQRRRERLPVPRAGEGLRFGFFSRLSVDKGLGRVAAILARLREAGWPVASLDLCGTCVDADVLEALERELRSRRLAITYHGELPHRRTLEVMASVDVVLFPTTSSFEAGGRVVLEAYNLGKTVIASDYCAARDVLADPFRIPVSMGEVATGATDEPFNIGDIAVGDWEVPHWQDENFHVENCERYRFDPAALRRLMDDVAAARQESRPAPQPGGNGVPAPLRMTIDWDAYRSQSPSAWCDTVRAHMLRDVNGRADLIDLGGAMKRSLLRAGFGPTVVFEANGTANLRKVAI